MFPLHMFGSREEKKKEKKKKLFIFSLFGLEKKMEILKKKVIFF